MPNKRLERTRHERASSVGCVGEPLKRNVLRFGISSMIARPQCILLVFFLSLAFASWQVTSSKGRVSFATSRANSVGWLHKDSRIDVPPGVVIRCPDKPLVEGEPTIFYADAPKLPRASFKWKVSHGRITKGQGTRTITVDTDGAGGKKLKASVEMNDGHNHLTMTYCEIEVKLRNSQ